MNTRIDLTGQKFGRLTAIYAVTWGPTKWMTRCDCGNESIVAQGNLRNGHTQSCGCLLLEMEHGLRHGHDRVGARSGTLRSYSQAKNRCLNPNSPKYSDYGGRGITMCDEWCKSFPDFLRDMGEKPDGTSLERINNDGNYEPGNCRWATPKEQSRNKRNNVWLEYQGRVVILKDCADLMGIDPSLLRYRLSHGLADDARIIKR